MQVFVYEYITGGGLGLERGEGSGGSLLAEGDAMLRAAVADFAALENVEVVTTRDVRCSSLDVSHCRVTRIANAREEFDALLQLAAGADWTLLIAPETGGALAERCRLVESCGGRLLSPSAACVQIATNKQATAELLSRFAVPVPRGAVLEPGQHWVPPGVSFPAVVKPIDGCGSEGLRLMHRPEEIWASHERTALRIEEYVPGLPASVAVLCGPAECHALPACEQRLSSDGHFTYRGGRLPLDPELDARARRLALGAAGALPGAFGYLGVDLVLGHAADGSGDRVIEINPRLTTSYIGLRALCRGNLAAAMLAVAGGGTPDLSFGDQTVEFMASGAGVLVCR